MTMLSRSQLSNARASRRATQSRREGPTRAGRQGLACCRGQDALGGSVCTPSAKCKRPGHEGPEQPNTHGTRLHGRQMEGMDGKTQGALRAGSRAESSQRHPRAQPPAAGPAHTRRGLPAKVTFNQSRRLGQADHQCRHTGEHVPPVHLMCVQNLLEVAKQLLGAQYGEELQQKVPRSAAETSRPSGSRASPPPTCSRVRSHESPSKEKVEGALPTGQVQLLDPQGSRQERPWSVEPAGLTLPRREPRGPVAAAASPGARHPPCGTDWRAEGASSRSSTLSASERHRKLHSGVKTDKNVTQSS